MQLFYDSEISPDNSEFTFGKDESRHIHKVLRLKTRDRIRITNGKGYFFDAEITISEPKSCSVRILNKINVAPMPYTVHLAVAPTKLNDRYEWFLEKATEIGITEITPIICDHSERKVIKLERYQKIIESAVKQSLKAYLPILNESISFKNFIDRHQDYTGDRFIAHCEETERKLLKSELIPQRDVLILVGPEGDFSSEEIEYALQRGYTAVTLGESRLRTETAAVVACHSVAFVNESV